MLGVYHIFQRQAGSGSISGCGCYLGDCLPWALQWAGGVSGSLEAFIVRTDLVVESFKVDDTRSIVGKLLASTTPA